MFSLAVAHKFAICNTYLLILRFNFCIRGLCIFSKCTNTNQNEGM